MADIKAQEATDTGLSDATDTTTNEDADTSLEDSDESWDDGDITSDSDDATTDEAATETEEATEEESNDDVETEEAPEDKFDDATEELNDDKTTEDTPIDAEAERKAAAQEARKAREETRQARAEADAVRKQAEEANIDRYLQEAADDEDLLEKRTNEVETYRIREERIALNEERLETNVLRAVNDIDLFKNGTPAVQERLIRALDQFEANNITKDSKGRPVEIRGDVYAILQSEADSIKSLLGDGAKQQEATKARQKSRTVATPTRSPRQPKIDPDIAAFDEAVNRGW